MSLDLRIVTMSKGRPEQVQAMAMGLFPDTTVVVPWGEKGTYEEAGVSAEQLVVHPRDISGIGPVRQWCLDHFDEEFLVIVDDDTHSLYSLIGHRSRNVSTPEFARAVIEQTAICARDAGAPIWGYSQVGDDIRKVRPMKPFTTCSWAGSVIGFVGRQVSYDTNLRLRADIDLFLQALMEQRFVWIDNRFCFQHHRFDMQGGLAADRSQSRNDSEITYLKKKWGQYLKTREAKTTVLTKINVKRQQSIKGI